MTRRNRYHNCLQAFSIQLDIETRALRKSAIVFAAVYSWFNDYSSQTLASIYLDHRGIVRSWRLSPTWLDKYLDLLEASHNEVGNPTWSRLELIMELSGTRHAILTPPRGKPHTSDVSAPNLPEPDLLGQLAERYFPDIPQRSDGLI